jgi:hypothetical protein
VPETALAHESTGLDIYGRLCRIEGRLDGLIIRLEHDLRRLAAAVDAAGGDGDE